MKVGVPTMGSDGLEEGVSSHFGRAPTFTLVDTKSDDIEIVPNIKKTERSGQPPEQLSNKGVEVMLCSDLGPRAIRVFEQAGIEVFVGARGTVKDALDYWKSDGLKEATDKDACEEHRREFSS